MNIKITGIGHYLPEYIQTSKELSSKINKSEDWIVSRTGVKERRVSKIDVDEMGAKAARISLKMANIKPDLILNASGVAKQVIPDTSVFFQRELRLNGIPSFSIHATCLSFLVALHAAANYIEQGSYNKILIISSDRGTRGRNYNEPESAALLGDAAAAIVLEKSVENENSKLLSYKMESWPQGANLTEVRGGGTNLHPQDNKTTLEDNLFSMNGPGIYKMARKKVYDRLKEDLKENNLNPNDINLLIPHQASGLAVKAYSKYGGFDEKQVINTIDTTGNCVAASIPLALSIAYEQNKLKRGDLIYFAGTGAGLSIGSMLLKF